MSWEVEMLKELIIKKYLKIHKSKKVSDMNWIKRIFVILIIVIPANIYSQESKTLPPPPKYNCNFTDKKIVIDGFITDAAWISAPRTESFKGIVSGGPVKYETYTKMLWNNEGFYLAYYIQEEDIRGIITSRDAFSYYDNDVEVFFDPDGDGLNYFELEMTALNSVYDIHWDKRLTWGEDAKTQPPGTWNINFDFIGLETAIQYDGTLNWRMDKDKCWTVELFFPWKSFSQYANMPLPPKVGDTWRVDFYRGELGDTPNSRGQSYSWAAHGKVNMHIPERFGFVTFVKK